LKQLFLINVTGQDRPGVTASLTEILSSGQAQVLDVGQAVIHDSLSLGILVAADEDCDVDTMLHKINNLSSCENIQVSVLPIAQKDYQQWVDEQEKPRHIVTVLGRAISAEHIARISREVAKHGLNIDKINRLSGRIALDADINQAKACVEFSLRGTTSDLQELRSAFLSVASELNIDIAYQEDNIYRRYRRLVVFDMDSTLIEAEVIDELAKEAGVGEQVAAITEQAMRGEIDFKESFRRRVGLLKGLDESVLERVAERIKMTEGAEMLISTLCALGYKTGILSGGFTYFANRLQQQLGIDYIHANQLEIENGKVTGRVVGEVVDGARKAALLRQIAAQENITLEQVIAVGDGANDLPMLSLAGLGIAFRAKPIVRQTAKQAISNIGLDGVLYLIGFRDRDWLNKKP